MDNLIIEHADIFGPCANRNGTVSGWRNFEGRKGQYNRPGDRNFNLKITDAALADQLARDGWNIKELKKRDPDEPTAFYLPVKVNFGVRPPHIVQCANKRKVVLNEGTVKTLDFAQIEDCYVALHGRVWEDNGQQRVTAYLTDMVVKLRDTPFADLYPDFEETDTPF